ncbi:hypothetical protein ACI7BZ_19175 [Xanthobacter sp. AM11]|uniref:hypothetical protein n=1 Tax=Xanthobacter sp. AM11 TaxID=3380643 RepID=UPI0039BEE5AA
MSDMDTLVRNLRILLRADLIIAEIHLRRLTAKSGLYAFAALVGGFGAVMLGIAGFLALEQVYGPILAATISGAAGMVLAVLLVLVGASLKPGRELDVANEVHTVALEAVSRDLKAAEAGVSRIVGIVRNPFDSALPAVLMQVFGMVLKAVRGRSSGGA